MTEEEKQKRSDSTSAQDIYNALGGVLGDLVEIYSITSRWDRSREDLPSLDGSRTKASVDLIKQYVESIETELSAASIRRIK